MTLNSKYFLIVLPIVLFVFLFGCAGPSGYLKLDPALNKDIRSFNRTDYIPMVRLCDTYGIKLEWDQYTRKLDLRKNGSMAMRVGSDKILVNGQDRRLQNPVIMKEGVVYVPVSFVRSSLGYIVEPSITPAIREEAPVVSHMPGVTIRTIVLDPGHGGKDPGAIGRRMRLREKNLTLEIAKRLMRILQSKGVRVIMTRTDDTFIPLPRRTAIANENNADLFVSIHINASKSRALSGFECYYLSDATDDNARAVAAMENAALKLSDSAVVADHATGLDKALWDMTLTENRKESATLAGYICRSVDTSIIARNRGTKTARFFVLKGTRMPAVLVETGYISNRGDEMKFKDPGYLDRMAEVIAKGILDYRGEYERTEGFTHL